MDGCTDCGEMYRQQVNIYTDGRDIYIYMYVCVYMYLWIADGWKKIHGIYGRQVNGWIDGDWINEQMEKMIQFSFDSVIEPR